MDHRNGAGGMENGGAAVSASGGGGGLIVDVVPDQISSTPPPISNRIIPPNQIRSISSSSYPRPKSTPPLSFGPGGFPSSNSWKRLSIQSPTEGGGGEYFQDSLDDQDDQSDYQHSPRSTPHPHHSRTNSLRRKPVPAYLALPNTSLPPSHPFAQTISPSASNPSSPAIPTTPAIPNGVDNSPRTSTPISRGPVPPLRKLPSGSRPNTIRVESSSMTPTPDNPLVVGGVEGSTMSRRVSIRNEAGVGNIPSRSSSLRLPKAENGGGEIEADAAGPPARPSRNPSRNATPTLPSNGTVLPPATPTAASSPVPDLGSPTVSNTESQIQPETPQTTNSSTVPHTAIPGDTTPKLAAGSPIEWKGISGGPPVTPKRGGGTLRLTKNFGQPLHSPPRSRGEGGADDNEDDYIFSVDRKPSQRRLWEAGTLFVQDEVGQSICFGDLLPTFPTPEEQSHEPSKPLPRTVVLFIRNWGCGQCQDYVEASISQLDPKALEQANVKVIVIGNGHWKAIRPYRSMFHCPFPMYTDQSRQLYAIMGMIKFNNKFGPWSKGRAAYHQRPVHKQVVRGFRNLTKMGSSAILHAGKITQLGGEFVLSPGYKCDFAHRMTNVSNHMEAADVLREAGVLHPTKAETIEMKYGITEDAEAMRMREEMHNWKKTRQIELERIRRRRAERRGEEYIPGRGESRIESDSGDDDGEEHSITLNGTDLTHSLNGHSTEVNHLEMETEEEEEEEVLACSRPNGIDDGTEEVLLDEDGNIVNVDDFELSSLHRLSSFELERRFSAAMKLEEEKEKELQAAAELREAKERGNRGVAVQ